MHSTMKIILAGFTFTAIVIAGVMIFQKQATKPIQFDELPDFSAIGDVKIKKELFFDYLYPMVKYENEGIGELRNKIEELKSKSSLTQSDQEFLLATAKQFSLTEMAEWDSTKFDPLLSRVDIVPASLALAQAANESAWGTSRFALEANNLFGQWCFTKGCGVVPKARDAGKKHEVAKFDSVHQSVKAYINNINSGGAYNELRQIRKNLREQKQPIKGDLLANGLVKYSERGSEYIKEIQAMIRINKLGSYDIATE